MTPASVEIPSLHTPDMQLQELEAMLGIPQDGCRLTPGTFMLLVASSSPFITGGEIQKEHLAKARRILKAPDASPEDIMSSITTGLRPFSIIEQGPDTKPCGYSGFCPEWLADLYRAAAECGGISWHDFLWRLPMATAAHLLAAAHRYNGGTTARPADWKKALSSISKTEEESDEEKRANEQVHKDNHGIQ